MRIETVLENKKQVFNTPCHSQFVENIVDNALKTLKEAKSLSPDFPYIHTTLGMLEGVCKTPFTKMEIDHILASIEEKKLVELRQLLSVAELEDEYYHAQYSQASLYNKLHSNYGKMVENETYLLRKYKDITPLSSCVFVGCGPMPLTAILLHHYLKCLVVGIDCSLQRLKTGQKFIANHNLSSAISLQHCQGESYDFSGADIIYIASMVPNKMDVFRRILLTNTDALVITRGGEGLRQFFYEAVDIEGLANMGWQCLEVSPPPEGIKNTSYLFKHAF